MTKSNSTPTQQAHDSHSGSSRYSIPGFKQLFNSYASERNGVTPEQLRRYADRVVSKTGERDDIAVNLRGQLPGIAYEFVNSRTPEDKHRINALVRHFKGDPWYWDNWLDE